MEAIDVVRGLIEDYRSGGLGIRWLHDDIAWHQELNQPDAKVHRSPSQVERMMESYQSIIVEPQLTFDEPVDCGGGWVLATFQGEARGRSSGASVEVRETHLYRVRGDRVAEAREFRTAADARAWLAANAT